jgi:hypothetical protein
MATMREFPRIPPSQIYDVFFDKAWLAEEGDTDCAWHDDLFGGIGLVVVAYQFWIDPKAQE